MDDFTHYMAIELVGDRTTTTTALEHEFTKLKDEQLRYNSQRTSLKLCHEYSDKTKIILLVISEKTYYTFFLFTFVQFRERQFNGLFFNLQKSLYHKCVRTL